MGMRMLGKMAGEGEGFDGSDLNTAKETFEALGKTCELYDLRQLGPADADLPEAQVLVIRNTASLFGRMDDMKKELLAFEWDTKYWDTRRKRVLNKQARSNVCFDEEGSAPDYENKQGTVVAWSDVPSVLQIRSGLEIILGKKGKDLVCEGNRYFSHRCGIGFHGDSERRKVAGVRFGVSMSMHWCWHYQYSAVGCKLELDLHDGDMYIMSEKAVGTDWKRKNVYTLRHAAGAAKYLKEKRRVVEA